LAQLSAGTDVHILMKKVLLVFLGLVVLLQVFKIWERERSPASVNRHVPARTYHAHPGHGGVFETRLDAPARSMSVGEHNA